MANSLGDFKRQIAQFEKKVINKIIRDALKEGAKEFVAPVKSEAPVASGKVKASIKVRAGRRSRKGPSYRLMVSGGHPSEVIGFVVLPTKNSEGNPFIQRAFEANKDRVLSSVLKKIKDGIESQGK